MEVYKIMMGKLMEKLIGRSIGSLLGRLIKSYWVG